MAFFSLQSSKVPHLEVLLIHFRISGTKYKFGGQIHPVLLSSEPKVVLSQVLQKVIESWPLKILKVPFGHKAHVS